MAICPNCGSWVDEGDICMSCGGSGSYSSNYRDEDEPSYTSSPSYSNPRPSLNENNYAKAKSLFNSQRYEESISYCESCQNDYSHGHEVWELKGDSYLALNRYSEAISCYESGLKFVNNSSKWTVYPQVVRAFEKEAFQRRAKAVQTEKYQIIARFVASKIIALMRSGRTETAKEVYMEYAFIKKSEFPVYTNDKYSSERYTLYPEIRKYFSQKKSKFNFQNLEVPESKFKSQKLELPERYIYCNNCGQKIDYLKYREKWNYSCPSCGRLVSSYSNTYKEYLDLKEQERIKKEKQEKDPVYLKTQINHCKKRIFGTYILWLTIEFFQKKADKKFAEMLRYKELLEKCNAQYTKDEIKALKKETKHIKFLISHVLDDKYTDNAKKVCEINQKKLDELEPSNKRVRIKIL